MLYVNHLCEAPANFLGWITKVVCMLLEYSSSSSTDDSPPNNSSALPLSQAGYSDQVDLYQAWSWRSINAASYRWCWASPWIQEQQPRIVWFLHRPKQFLNLAFADIVSQFAIFGDLNCRILVRNHSKGSCKGCPTMHKDATVCSFRCTICRFRCHVALKTGDVRKWKNLTTSSFTARWKMAFGTVKEPKGPFLNRRVRWKDYPCFC